MCQNAGYSPNEVFPQINVINYDYSSYFRGTGKGWNLSVRNTSLVTV